MANGIQKSLVQRPSEFVVLVRNVPQIIDNLDQKDILRLCQVNKDLYRTIQDPVVWRKQFAKMVDCKPQSLPEPSAYQFKSNQPFRKICKGLSLAHQTPEKKRLFTRREKILARYAKIYLRRHMPRSLRALGRIAVTIEKLEFKKQKDQSAMANKYAHGLTATLSASGAIYYFHQRDIVMNKEVEFMSILLWAISGQICAMFATILLFQLSINAVHSRKIGATDKILCELRTGLYHPGSVNAKLLKK